MTHDRSSQDQQEVRDEVARRYSALARSARAGQQITDCDADAFIAG